MKCNTLGAERQQSDAVAKTILSTRGEAAVWRCMFDTLRDTAGMPKAMRRALLVAAAWRLALTNARTLQRRKDRGQEVQTVLAAGHDLHIILSGAGFRRLECEAIAVDALHVSAASLKRREAANG